MTSNITLSKIYDKSIHKHVKNCRRQTAALPDSTTNRKHSRQWTVPFNYTTFCCSSRSCLMLCIAQRCVWYRSAMLLLQRRACVRSATTSWISRRTTSDVLSCCSTLRGSVRVGRAASESVMPAEIREGRHHAFGRPPLFAPASPIPRRHACGSSRLTWLTGSRGLLNCKLFTRTPFMSAF